MGTEAKVKALTRFARIAGGTKDLHMLNDRNARRMGAPSQIVRSRNVRDGLARNDVFTISGEHIGSIVSVDPLPFGSRTLRRIEARVVGTHRSRAQRSFADWPRSKGQADYAAERERIAKYGR